MNTNLLAATGTPANDASLAQSDFAVLSGTAKQTSSSPHTKINNLSEETFSALLAQQIQGAGMLTQSAPPVSAAIDTAAASASDKKTLQNKSEISSETNIVNDTTGALAAIMLQLQIPTSNVYIEGTPQDKGTVLPGEISTSSVNNSGYSAKRDDGGFNPRAESYLKSTVADSLSSNNNSGSPLIQRESTNTAQSTLPQQPEEPSTGIAMGLPVTKSPLFASEAIQNTKEFKEVGTKKTGNSTKIDALNQADTTTSDSLEKSQNESPLSIIATDPQRNKETNTSSIVQTKDSLNPTTSFSSSTLHGNTANYLSTNLTQTISSPLGADKWSNDFSQKIIWMCTQQNQVAELHLNPADLGPLNVTLKISNDQLTAQFTSPHSTVREAIESAMPKLREILADNGIMLSNASVSDQSPRDRGTEGYTNQDSRATKQPEIPESISNAMASANTKMPPSPTRRHNGILDTFA